MRWIIASMVCVATVGTFGCATYLDDLNRAERHYQSNHHEQALALFRALEPDIDSLSHADRARYAYLRGLNDYRLSGHQDESAVTTETPSATSGDKACRAHARYWFGIARALEKQRPGSLRKEWMDTLDEALRDLNQDVFGVGVFPDDTDSPSTDSKPEDSNTKSSETDEPDES